MAVDSMRNAPCAVCRAEVAKYTCPFCAAATCSLPCFNEHKANSACASARASHERREAIGAPSSLLLRGERDPSRFVPMRSYDYNQMMQDYQFLSQVGRVVSSTGRNLADARMLQEPGRPNTPARRLPAAQHRRELLSKQIGFLKLPVMLLPEGMSKRQQNKTTYDTKKKQVLYTLQCAFPCARPARTPVAVHAMPGTTELGACLASALSVRDAADEPDRKRPRADTPSDLGALGLVRDTSGADRLVPQHETLLLLRIYPLRLRNETTTRFLDWWARKGAAMHDPSASAEPARAEPLVPQHVLDTVARLHGNDPDTAEEALAWSSTALYVAAPSEASLERVLRSLPDDYGIVEFFELEVWPEDTIRAAERRGRARVLALLPVPREAPTPRKAPGPGANNDSGAAPADNANERGRASPSPPRESPTVHETTSVPAAVHGGARDEARMAEAPAAAVSVPPAPRVSAPQPASTAAAAESTLVAYASSESEEE